MRLIAQSNLVAFWTRHPETRPALQRWARVVKEGHWQTTTEIQSQFSGAKVLNAERIRFEIAGGNYRLIAAFKFKNQIAFVKFVGTHSEYDKIDAMKVSQF